MTRLLGEMCLILLFLFLHHKTAALNQFLQVSLANSPITQTKSTNFEIVEANLNR